MSLESGKDNEYNPNLYNDKVCFLDKPVLFNIMFVVDIASSKLSQIEHIQDIDNPASANVDRINKSSNTGTRPRIIREININANENEESGIFRPVKSIYKLLLRDRFNNYSFAYEHNDKLPFLNQSTNDANQLYLALGSRIVVKKGAMIRHGALLLTRATCDYLGKVEEDKELVDSLGGEITKKYIEILTNEMNS